MLGFKEQYCKNVQFQGSDWIIRICNDLKRDQKETNFGTHTFIKCKHFIKT